eukprot:4867677-Prymnesium_polylepis.1
MQHMMLVDTSNVWILRLGFAIKMEGVLFSVFWLLAYTMKFGMMWHDAGPPFGPTNLLVRLNFLGILTRLSQCMRMPSVSARRTGAAHPHACVSNLPTLRQLSSIHRPHPPPLIAQSARCEECES